MTHAKVPAIQHLPLDQRVVERDVSLFHGDLAAAEAELTDLIGGSRMLLIGAAGSIGASTLRAILPFGPRLVHVIDHNENGLAELARDLRSSRSRPALPELLLLPFDLGGDPFRLWLAANAVDYDIVLNFAALKHVRSEKDPYSILAMLETNVLHLDRLARLLGDRAGVRRVFSVSTDKAANPTSMMGATKRLMEHALFLPTQPWSDRTAVTSARFANVAFSNGSLLHAWQNRLAARQPLACPDQTRRFFVTLEESGHLCTLASLLGAAGSLSVPALDPSQYLVLLSDVVERFLGHHGYAAHFTHDEDEARRRVDELARQRRWPVLLTPLDTGGEKPYEEFVGVGETAVGSRFETLRELRYLPPDDPTSFPTLIETLRAILAGRDATVVTVDHLKELIAAVEPAFAAGHHASTKTLDQRM